MIKGPPGGFPRVLIVTSEWPVSENDITGIHVVNQVNSLKEAGVNVSVFNFLGHKNPLNYLRAIINFRRLNFEDYDLVHAHHGQSGIVALSQKSLPVVVTFHGSDLQGIFNKRGHVTLQGRILQFVSRTVARLADEIIIVSEHMSSTLPPRRYHVIPAGIDIKLFSPMPIAEARAMLGLPSDRHLVLFVGNPARTEKRFWLARESVEILRDHYKDDAELIAVHGISNEKMPVYMNACNVLLLTSLSEGSPTVLKEALACDLPVVSVDVGDVRQRIAGIKGCTVCKDSRPATMAQALYSVLKSPQRISGREAVQELDERFLVEKVIDVYKGVSCPAF